MLTWRNELRVLLDRVPGAAERIARAVDEKRIDGSLYGYYSKYLDCGCAYGHAYRDASIATDAARQAVRDGFVDIGGSMLETMLHWKQYAELRAECVQWLAEHGATEEAVPAPMVEAR